MFFFLFESRHIDIYPINRREGRRVRALYGTPAERHLELQCLLMSGISGHPYRRPNKQQASARETGAHPTNN
jgi:hypothetical protein